MAEVKLPVLPKSLSAVDGILAETPDGKRMLHVSVFHNDAAVSAGKPEFDGHEQLDAFIITNSQDPQKVALTYAGSQNGVDQHIADVPVDRSINAANIRIAVMAKSNAGSYACQQFGSDAAVQDVGKVTARGIAWHGGVQAVEIAGYNSATRTLPSGGAVAFDNHASGAHGNLKIEMEVYAPGITTLRGTGSAQAYEELQRRIQSLEMHLEGPFFDRNEELKGRIALTVDRRTGPNNNNLVFQWSAGNPANFMYDDARGDMRSYVPPTGRYPMTLKSGDTVLGQFVLDWKTDAR